MINKSNTYVSKVLTNISLGYRNDNYIAEKIMPAISVKKDTAQISTYGMDNLRIVKALRAQWSWANEVNHSVSIWDHYVLADHALKELVTKEEYDNADAPIKPETDATENLTDRMQVIKEYELAVNVMASTTIITQNTTLSGTDQWSDPDNSDPIGDITTAIETIRAATGKKPNTFVIPYATMMVLKDHPQILDRILNSTGVVTMDLVMSVLMKAFPNIKEIMIGDAQYNGWVEGGTDSLTDIWGKHFWVMYIEKKPRLKSRSFGYTYQKNGENRRVKVLKYDEDKEGRYVRVNDKYDQKLVDEKCAYLIKNAVA